MALSTPKVSSTGYYGSLTEAAVKRFQQKHNIVSSGTPLSTGYGTVGPKTRTTLNSLLATPLELTAPTELSSNGASPNTPPPTAHRTSPSRETVLFSFPMAHHSQVLPLTMVSREFPAYFWKKLPVPVRLFFPPSIPKILLPRFLLRAPIRSLSPFQMVTFCHLYHCRIG